MFPDHNFILVSDDRLWCEQNMNMTVFNGSTPFVDMCMLSMCDHNIIANSSFSWWGAWLGNRGKVVCPSGWFGPNLKDHNTEDLYCEGWTVI